MRGREWRGFPGPYPIGLVIWEQENEELKIIVKIQARETAGCDVIKVNGKKNEVVGVRWDKRVFIMKEKVWFWSW